VGARSTAPTLEMSAAERQRFLDQLSFGLTDAQLRVVADIESSVASARPMSAVAGRRGLGKDGCGRICALRAGIRGYQSAIMAPTEILAGQHFQSLSKLLTRLVCPSSS